MGEGVLYCGSYDNTIRVWNPTTGECVSTLVGHSSSVVALAVGHGLLYSGSLDKTVMVWLA